MGVGAYVSLCVIMLLGLPNTLWDEVPRRIVIVIGALGLWRFGWWACHVIRAWLFLHVVFPKKRQEAQALWDAGRRPKRLHIMATTFRERADVTTQVVRSIIREVKASGLPTTIWLGSGDASDEELYSRLISEEAPEIDLVIARQDKPGKRYAIGIALRAMRRNRIDPNDIVVFMDGDSLFGHGMLEKCVPMFLADPRLGALTTDEEVQVHGPRWVSTWLEMRFAQRRIAMQSHAISNKVLTLTGRLSLFRAHLVIDPGFIRMIEDDHLEHWLWGRFRFLSGDDKSSWYYLLGKGVRMTYVPDALSITIEHIEGSGYDRMVQNLRRWSGNMLRNGSRAIALGPRRVGFFIWWCIIDQRLAMWTMLFSPVLAAVGTALITPAFLVTYIVWVMMTRLLQAMVLYAYSDRVSMAYPVLLYVNQFVNAAVKVYCIFRLSKQRWTNRGDQKAGFNGGFKDKLRDAMATYLTITVVFGLVVAVICYTGVLRLPSIYTLSTLWIEMGLLK